MKTATQKSMSWQTSAIHAAEIIGPPDSHFMEHRWGRRRLCRARVQVSSGDDISGGGRLRDVSMSGAFLETSLPLPLNSQLAIVLVHESPTQHAAEFSATVIRREPAGVGIEWTETASMPVCRMLGCTEACAFVAAEPR